MKSHPLTPQILTIDQHGIYCAINKRNKKKCIVTHIHAKETVLGKAAMYLNARIPELTSVRVATPEELEDFEEVIDEFTGEVRAYICLGAVQFIPGF